MEIPSRGGSDKSNMLLLQSRQNRKPNLESERTMMPHARFTCGASTSTTCSSAKINNAEIME